MSHPFHTIFEHQQPYRADLSSPRNLSYSKPISFLEGRLKRESARQAISISAAACTRRR